MTIWTLFLVALYHIVSVNVNVGVHVSIIAVVNPAQPISAPRHLGGLVKLLHEMCMKRA